MVIQTDLENQDTLIMKTFMIGPKLSIMDSNRLRLIDGQTIFGINIRIIELCFGPGLISFIPSAALLESFCVLRGIPNLC